MSNDCWGRGVWRKAVRGIRVDQFDGLGTAIDKGCTARTAAEGFKTERSGAGKEVEDITASYSGGDDTEQGFLRPIGRRPNLQVTASRLA